MLLVEQLVHQRCVHPGPLVLGANPLKFPNVHSGYKPNCLTRVHQVTSQAMQLAFPSLLMARTISSPVLNVIETRGRRMIGHSCGSYLICLWINRQNQSLRGQKCALIFNKGERLSSHNNVSTVQLFS
jgi:hypothetical protein